MSGVVYRTASAAEVRLMADWAAAEGWNPGLDDAEAFHATDPKGFFVADMAGQLAACISVVNHSPDFAFLGFYICHPSHRGKGFGYALWHHALNHAGSRTVGLDGVSDQESNYARSGFVRTGSTIRLEGTLSGIADRRVTPAGPGDLAALAEMDAEANGFARAGFLSEWLATTANRKTFVLRDGARLVGFATLRRCRTGLKIGPVVAPNAEDALALVRAGLNDLPASPAIIDVPSQNHPLLDALSSLGFAETFATARMYKGPAPQTSLSLQAIATMELG